MMSTSMLASLMLVGAPIPPEPQPDPLAPGYMGIRIQSGTLTIESVEPGMPASKAGIQPHDVIVRVGTLEPRLFEEVVDHICSFRPGAIVEIEVKRGGEKKLLKVKLGVRPPELDRNRQRMPLDIPPP
jgi:S1-C subfamily serine protease